MEELESAAISSVPKPFSFSWDTFCNLLDDRPSDETEGDLSGASIRKDSLQELLRKPGQYFFPSHSNRHPLEVFWLKLCLFKSLSQQVALFHKRTQRPLLRLDSRHVHVMLNYSDYCVGYLPIRWNASVQLPSAIDTPIVNVDDMPAEMKSMVSQVPNNIDSVYIPAGVRDWPIGREVRGTALIESADPIPCDAENRIQVLLRIHFISDTIAAHDFSQRDVFCLRIPFSSESIKLWARKVDSPERGIVISGSTGLLSNRTVQALQRECHQAISRASATIYRSYPSISDGYSLGMLLLRALLGSESSRWDRVQSIIPSINTRLPPVVQGIESSDFYTMHTRIRDLLKEQGDIFVNQRIPDDLWWDGMLIGLRAISVIPGFSYGYPPPDEITAQMGGSLEDLQLEAAQFAERVRIELFESEERGAAILAACRSALEPLAMA